jgi:hypothetical protein
MNAKALMVNQCEKTFSTTISRQNIGIKYRKQLSIEEARMKRREEETQKRRKREENRKKLFQDGEERHHIE